MDKTLAEIAYDAYCTRLERIAEWESVPERIQTAWANAAYQVLKAADFATWNNARREWIAEHLGNKGNA